MLKKDVERSFRATHVPALIKAEADGRPDYPRRREAWNDHIDRLIKYRLLPEKAGDWSHPRWLLAKKLKV